MYRWLFIVLVVVTILSLFQNNSITGANVQGNISLCIYTLNPLSAIEDQNVSVGEFYNYTIPCQSYCNETVMTDFIALPYGCNANLTNIQLNTTTGIISGTPNASEVGTFLMIVRCKTNCCWDTEMFYLTINPGNTSNQTNMTNVTLPAPNISISYDGNVSVNWSDENAPTYTVFYSSNISAIVLLNTSNVPADVYNVSGITSLNWTDLNHSDDTRRYYTVASVNGTFMNLSRDMPVGKNTWNFTILNSSVYGALSTQAVGIYLDKSYTASSFLQYIPSSLRPSVTMLQKGDATGETLLTHVKGLLANDFTMNPGSGYFVTLDSDYPYTVVGRVFRPPYVQNYTVVTSSVYGALSTNFVTIYDGINHSTASSYVNSMNNSLRPSISRFLKSDLNGEYLETHVLGLLLDFDIEPAEGYFVTLDDNSSHVVKNLEVNTRW